jgi:outer membrane protein TolC
VRDVELALIQGATAQDSAREAMDTLDAAEQLFRASEAAQRAGRLSLFDLEIARSALLSAQNAVISARRERARAWVALVKATGNATVPGPIP